MKKFSCNKPDFDKPFVLLNSFTSNFSRPVLHRVFPVIILFWVLIILFCLVGNCDFDGENHGDGPLEPKENSDDDNGDDDCVDNDQDGWCEANDCNDFNKSINPGAMENCYDGQDNDCDFQIDEEDSDCPGSVTDDDDIS